MHLDRPSNRFIVLTSPQLFLAAPAGSKRRRQDAEDELDQEGDESEDEIDQPVVKKPKRGTKHTAHTVASQPSEEPGPSNREESRTVESEDVEEPTANPAPEHVPEFVVTDPKDVRVHLELPVAAPGRGVVGKMTNEEVAIAVEVALANYNIASVRRVLPFTHCI